MRKPYYFSRGFIRENERASDGGLDDLGTADDHRYDRQYDKWVKTYRPDEEGIGFGFTHQGRNWTDYDQARTQPRMEHLYTGKKSVYAIFAEASTIVFVGILTKGKDLLPYSVRKLIEQGVPMHIVHEDVSVEEAIDLKAAVRQDLIEDGWSVIQAIETGAVY